MFCCVSSACKYSLLNFRKILIKVNYESHHFRLCHVDVVDK